MTLLLTPAHRDPDITSFLSCWVFEEMWHGEAIGRVLEAHGEEAGAARIAALRLKRRRKEAISTLSTIGSAAFAGRAFTALHMTWGAVNEWTTQAGYARLSDRADHPTLRELLKRIMKQEGGHIDFYASEAARRLAESPRAQRLTRFALKHLWRPVGSGVMPREEVGFLVRYLFDGEEGNRFTSRIDRRVDRLPGQADLHLLDTAVSRLSRLEARDRARSVATPPRHQLMMVSVVARSLDRNQTGMRRLADRVMGLLARVLVRVFFRSVEVQHRENSPRRSGGAGGQPFERAG